MQAAPRATYCMLHAPTDNRATPRYRWSMEVNPYKSRLLWFSAVALIAAATFAVLYAVAYLSGAQ